MKNIALLILGIFCIQVSTWSQNNSNFKNEDDLKRYFSSNLNNLDLIEGIWSYSVEMPDLFGQGKNFVNIDAVKTAIIKNKNKYDYFTIYDGEVEYIERKRYLKTSSSTRYIQELEFYDPRYKKDRTIKNFADFTEENEFKVNVKDIDGEITKRETYVRIFPDRNAIIEAKEKEFERTGTGFAISSNGYVLTCNHVINDARNILVKSIKNNITYEYKATIAVADKNNDIAILKISDNNFQGFNKIPFTIKSNTSDVGTSIYILGYPLTSTMGEELKLTDGLISSKSGYQGDITSYQISAAAQPGNSGGPLFDMEGNLIGIVNAKHTEAENVNYAVKSNYLLNLIESLEPTPTFPNTNLLSGKTLVEQVNLVKDFVFMIEVK